MRWKIFVAFILSSFCLSCGGNYYNLRKSENQYYQMDAEDTADPSVSAMIAPYREQLEDQMGSTIGHCVGGLDKMQPEGSLGNWVADAILQQSEVYLGRDLDIGIANNGGLRIPNISEGDISLGKIYELMPFDNMLVVQELTGAQVQTLAEHIVASGGWPISKEVQITVSPDEVAVKINGAPLEKSGKYSMVISDYLANGGDQCAFLKEIPQIETGKLFREALIDAVKAATADGKNIEGKIEGRLQIIE